MRCLGAQAMASRLLFGVSPMDERKLHGLRAGGVPLSDVQRLDWRWAGKGRIREMVVHGFHWQFGFCAWLWLLR